jgi:hypothetical protein
MNKGKPGQEKTGGQGKPGDRKTGKLELGVECTPKLRQRKW